MAETSAVHFLLAQKKATEHGRCGLCGSVFHNAMQKSRHKELCIVDRGESNIDVQSAAARGFRSSASLAEASEVSCHYFTVIHGLQAKEVKTGRLSDANDQQPIDMDDALGTDAFIKHLNSTNPYANATLYLLHLLWLTPPAVSATKFQQFLWTVRHPLFRIEDVPDDVRKVQALNKLLPFIEPGKPLLVAF